MSSNLPACSRKISTLSAEAQRIADEIKDRVSKLKELGIGGDEIEKLCRLDLTFSNVVITKDFRIFLPGYDNVEVELSPLPKAVYILFLKHPKGIAFKDLPKYKKELSGIYKSISNREHPVIISRSLDDLVNPTKNSINEKCSRIREAFYAKVPEPLAEFYCVTGGRAMAKKIILDRKYVKFE
jgi:hypothetical protein